MVSVTGKLLKDTVQIATLLCSTIHNVQVVLF